MAKAERTTTPTPASVPAGDAVAADARLAAARGVEAVDTASAEAETPAAPAAPVRTTLADGSEYVVRPAKVEPPVVAMSKRRRDELQRTKAVARGRADGASPQAHTEGAGPASVNSSEA